MTSGGNPRVILVTRSTELDELLVRHGTRDQARFFLQSRGRCIEEIEACHRRFHRALQEVLQGIPTRWRRGRIDRSELAGFVFHPEDLILVLGPDGLVANVAKYLDGQQVVGINPDPSQVGGILVAHPPSASADLLQDAWQGRTRTTERTMVEARLDDGQRLLALNEIFVGHASHQSARYLIGVGNRRERQCSSGVIVATGTGATGWAKSICLDRDARWVLPAPEASTLVLLVREAWPSPRTQRTLTESILDTPEWVEVDSEMNEGGVIFGDGIETDRLEFAWGMRARVQVARERLRLVVA